MAYPGNEVQKTVGAWDSDIRRIRTTMFMAKSLFFIRKTEMLRQVPSPNGTGTNVGYYRSGTSGR